ncbi:MAG: pseudouridine-5'-phosphate glycosidase [Phycisphaerales bacterium JB039]
MPRLSTNILDARRAVALETTLLAHGVPAPEGARLATELRETVRQAGAVPAVVGVLAGRAVVGMTPAQLDELLAAPSLPKLNASNLGLALARGGSGATTVSATMELAAAAGVSLFATGGLGGVHPGLGERLDVSSDLLALARFPVAVVCSGVKSLLDVESSREALETLGVPVVGFRTEAFPAFYLAESAAGVDATFDDEAALIRFVDFELARTGRGVVIAQPAPNPIAPDQWRAWLEQARERVEAAGARGRDVTPRTLAALHEISAGATLRVNLELVRTNAALAGRLAALRP